MMLARVLSSEARERSKIFLLKQKQVPYMANLIHRSVARIALVKPEKARSVEDFILRGAQYGQITEKVRKLTK